MSNNSILQYISQEGHLNSATLEYLDDIITRFPYFQAAHFVKSKVLHSTNQLDFARAIKQAAIYAPDRSKLHEFINQHYIAPAFAENEFNQDTYTLVSDSELAELNLQEDEKAMHNFTDSLLQNLENNVEAEAPFEIKVEYDLDAESKPVLETEQEQAIDLIEEIEVATIIENAPEELVAKAYEEERDEIFQSGEYNMTSEDVGIDFMHPEIAEEAALKMDEFNLEDAISNDDEAAHEMASNQSLEEIISARLDEIERQAQTEDQLAEEMHEALNKNEKQIVDPDFTSNTVFSTDEANLAAEINITSEDIGIDFNQPEILEESVEENINYEEEEINLDDEAAHEMASQQSLEQVISDRINEIEIPIEEIHPETKREIIESNPSIEQINDESVDEDDLAFEDKLLQEEELVEEANLKLKAYSETNENELIEADNDFFGWLKKIKSPNTVKRATPNQDLISNFIDQNLIAEAAIESNFAIKEDDKPSIIDEFIEKDPRIEPMKASFYKASNMARKSVEFNDDVVSETLAAIFEKQGLAEKAIKAYEKLSLKYPDKSHLFAARIEKLKNTE